MTTFAILGNNSSIGYLLWKELNRRGHTCDLYAESMPTTDNGGINLRIEGSLPSIVLRQLKRRTKVLFSSYDIQLILGMTKRIGIKASHTINYFQGIEAVDRGEEHSFVSTLDLLEKVPSAVLLPRPVNIEKFKQDHVGPYNNPKIVVGHFWRRGSTVGDYAWRWFKNTDLLMESLDTGMYLEDHFTNREKMASVLSTIDVLAEQFRVGSYGVPAIEALLSGTPVVGYYLKEMIECPEAFEMIHSTTKDPRDINRKIHEASRSTVGSTSAIEEYHSARHSVDVLLDTLKKWEID